MRQAPGRVGRIVVGTTVATNAVIQRRGPRVVYVTNDGFRTCRSSGGSTRSSLYDLNWRKPKPLVRRRDCLGVPGASTSAAERRSRREEPGRGCGERAARARRTSEAVAVAVCLLFSYVEPRPRAARRARRSAAALPGARVSVSHEVSPIWREYERASTTIADAFVKPVVERLRRRRGSERRARRRGREPLEPARLQRRLPAAPTEARQRPAQLLLSGLAGGVIGGRALRRAAGHRVGLHARHGRHELRHRPRARRRAAVRATSSTSRSGSRSAIPCVAVADDRRRRRLDRLDRPRRAAARRAAERGRGARARRVRARRHGADGHRRQPACSAGSIPSTSSAGEMPLDGEAASAASIAALGARLGHDAASRRARDRATPRTRTWPTRSG